MERLYGARFAKPEVQIAFNNNSVTQNFLSITVSPQEIREIEAVAEPVRESVRAMYERYRPQALGNGNRESSGPIAKVEAEVKGRVSE